MLFIMEKIQEGYTVKQIGNKTFRFTINHDVPLELFLSPYLYK